MDTVEAAKWRVRVLTETIAWCAPRAALDRPASCLRAPELRPELVTSSQWVERRSEIALPDARAVQEAVAQLAHKRSRLLRARGNTAPLASPVSEPDLGGGRLLRCDSLDMTLLDGAAEYASKGFFDGDDLPPWDTWLWYDFGHVGAESASLWTWIPPDFIALAELGVEHNYFGCFAWATPDDIARISSIDGPRQ